MFVAQTGKHGADIICRHQLYLHLGLVATLEDVASQRAIINEQYAPVDFAFCPRKKWSGIVLYETAEDVACDRHDRQSMRVNVITSVYQHACQTLYHQHSCCKTIACRSSTQSLMVRCRRVPCRVAQDDKWCHANVPLVFDVLVHESNRSGTEKNLASSVAASYACNKRVACAETFTVA
eukprot:1213734-Amphidinium_carterae.2